MGLGSVVVGDAAPSIYAFRAATVRNILDLPDHFCPRAEGINAVNFLATVCIAATISFWL